MATRKKQPEKAPEAQKFDVDDPGVELKATWQEVNRLLFENSQLRVSQQKSEITRGRMQQEIDRLVALAAEKIGEGLGVEAPAKGNGAAEEATAA